MIIEKCTYCHSSKEGNWHDIEEWEADNEVTLPKEFKQAFAYVNYEICIKYEFDTEKRLQRIIAVDGILVDGPWQKMAL